MQPIKYLLEKPDFKTVDLSKISLLLEKMPEAYRKIVQSANEPLYLYWDDFRHKAISGDLTAEEQWFLVQQYRSVALSDTSIKSETGEQFKWLRPTTIDEHLHKIDMLMGGRLFPKSNVPFENKETYINRGVIEEAIASSQLEGAHTTRAAAKKLLLEKRKPRNESEQMIVNNYQAMMALENKFKFQPLSEEFLFELHSILTIGTVDPSEQKRFRRDDDQIIVQGNIGQETYTTHIPPKEEFLKEEIVRLIKYANDELEHRFVHPLIKAIFIHFWVGYLHPFTDGNGRIARALFYWYLLKNEYWAFSYIPISTVIKKSPIQYAKAYIYSEQDHHDVTYFFEYHLRKVNQAIVEFEEYVKRQFEQNKQIDKILSRKVILNDRQRQLLYYFISDEKASTTLFSHATINNISRQTAAVDLRILEKQHFIYGVREGKYIVFYPYQHLSEILKNKAELR